MILFIIKSSIVALIFLACYLLFFKNDKRFIFNRVFLLTGILMSLIIPFMNIEIIFEDEFIKDNHFISQISSQLEGNEILLSTTEKSTLTENPASIHPVLYLLMIGSLIMVIRFLKNLLSIHKMIRKGEKIAGKGIQIILSDQKVSAFSFFKNVFVSKSESNSLDSTILAHETIHVKHLHTLDIIFIELLLLGLWFNPFYWWFRKELKINHEYCADYFASQQSTSLKSYSKTLINSFQMPIDNTGLSLGSKFSYFLIKKRIKMLQKQPITKVRFRHNLIFTALIIMPLLLLLSCNQLKMAKSNPTENEQFTVIIDAGHGGIDAGAKSLDGKYSEKELMGKLINDIKAQDNSEINLIFTRSGDEYMGLKDRAEMTKKHQADLFLSLHMDNSPNDVPLGITAYTSEVSEFSTASQTYAKILLNNLKSDTQNLRGAEFVVLKNSKSAAVLLNLGAISSTEEIKMLTNEQSRMLIAQKILNALEEISKAS